MEGQRRSTGGSHTRPPPANTSRSLLHSLQSENETLRSDLLRAQQQGVSLQHQLDVLRSSTDQIVRDAVAVSGEQVRALEERCRLLAERLVAFKRDGQVSESAQVTFLLRAQLEERRFLKRGLTAMLESLAGAAAAEAEASVLSAAAADDGAHTGTLYRLVMAASNALLEHTAAAKLEKARTRLALEHAASVLEEVHGAIQNATRAAFEAARHAESVEEALLNSVQTGGGSSGDGPPLLTAASSLRGGFLTPSPARRVKADNSLNTPRAAGDRTSTSLNGTTTTWMAPPATLPLSEELEWVCDVLKACMRGVRDVGSDIATAAAELRAPLPTTSSSSPARHGPEDAALHAPKPPPLSEAASPEMNALLRSFFDDLAAVKQKASVQQEEMARQLAQEVQRHYASTQQYEERIQLLERECAGLLRYTERVAEENARRQQLSTSPTEPTAAPQAQRQPSVRAQRSVAGGTNGLSAAAPSFVEEEKDEGNRVTPERVTVRPHDTTIMTTPAPSPRERSKPRQLRHTATDTSVTDSSQQQAHPAHSSRATSKPARRARHRDAAHGRNGDDAAAKPPSKVDAVPRQSPFRETARPARSVASAEKPVLLSPRREPPPQLPPSRPTTPSAAARALWSYYQSRNSSLLGDASAVVGDSPRSRLSQRVMSPAPPPPPPPPPPPAPLAARSSTAAAAGVGALRGGSTSPWRRSVTASVPAGRSAAGALTTMLATSLSSVSSTSDLLSTPRRAAYAPDGLVSSQIGSRAATLWSALAHERAPAAPKRGDAVVAVARPLKAEFADPPLSPPRATSAASSRSDHSTNRTRLSQQLYDEAAADVFSEDLASTADGYATPTAARWRTTHSRSSSFSVGRDALGSADVHSVSPRRPVHIGLRVPQRASPSPQDALHVKRERRRCGDPPSPTPLPPPPERDVRNLVTAAASRLEEVQSAAAERAETTPVAWRRIKEEMTSQQHQQQHPSPLWQTLASPIAGASDLFGTPREASWMDSYRVQ